MTPTIDTPHAEDDETWLLLMAAASLERRGYVDGYLQARLEPLGYDLARIEREARRLQAEARERGE